MLSIVDNDIIKSKNDVKKWDQVRESFQKEFGEDVYRSWISHLNLVSLTEFEIVMSVPTDFIRDWIKREYFKGVFKGVGDKKVCVKRGVKQILLEFLPNLMSFEIVVDKSNNSLENSESRVVSISKNDNLFSIGTELNESYKFENFVVGKSNNLAYQVCKEVAEGRSISFGTNPLFLYGEVGLGKTHLCQAVAWELKRNKPDKQIIYLSAEKFMFLFIQSLSNQNVNDFKNKFRNVDTLIIDDIQFIVGKDKTQKEFFYTFDALISEQKQVILACDKSPVYLESLDEKLKSRLNGGLVIDIKEADYQLRLDFVRLKSKQLALSLTKDLEEFIAENITTNCREIEGCLKRLKINQDIMKINISKDNIESILCDNLLQYRKKISIDSIQNKVADYFNISLDDLKSEKRVKNLVFARHIAMYLAKVLTNKSFPDIAKKFNDKNHATIIHAVNKIKKEIEDNADTVKIINSISSELK